ncbi:unnamed protein product [Vitrella brassicaformis CCMP3155]|uniref:Ion transport domain-containing protein n=1 Tax=Vitrella brassicaformis (strain CCMP3155) TaxID=1169540 RepID=A0A0G4EL53_VITBC|nr:unnamed protein product [Vitrella brassicaformis CCMP3155]|eukprot:CEL97682.1 unnamed protein product [Vitrella brassicaformis CCMP3155]
MTIFLGAYFLWDWIMICVVDLRATDALVEFSDVARKFAPGSPECINKLEEATLIVQDLITAMTSTFGHRTVEAAMAVAMGIRFFHAFRKQPMLSVVTKTLSASMKDAFHLFFCIFYSFSFSGRLLFGPKMMMGWFEWRWLEPVGDPVQYPNTQIFIWIFTILVALIMLNMLLAVIIEAYLRIRASVSEEDTIWNSAKHLIKAVWRKHMSHMRLERLLYEHDKSLPDDLTYFHIAEKPRDPSYAPRRAGSASSLFEGLERARPKRKSTAGMFYWQQKQALAGGKEDVKVKEEANPELRLPSPIPPEQAERLLDGCVKWAHHIDSQTNLTVAEALVMIGRCVSISMSTQDSVQFLCRRVEALRSALGLPALSPDSISTPPVPSMHSQLRMPLPFPSQSLMANNMLRSFSTATVDNQQPVTSSTSKGRLEEFPEEGPALPLTPTSQTHHLKPHGTLAFQGTLTSPLDLAGKFQQLSQYPTQTTDMLVKPIESLSNQQSMSQGQTERELQDAISSADFDGEQRDLLMTHLSQGRLGGILKALNSPVVANSSVDRRKSFITGALTVYAILEKPSQGGRTATSSEQERTEDGADNDDLDERLHGEHCSVSSVAAGPPRAASRPKVTLGNNEP